jgi:type I restriction-modification system DNA methylase subunit
MANERITEDIVRQHFKADALFPSVKFEEQKSSNKRIIDLLKGKSKTGGTGDGRPEFIISFPTNSNYIIVVECKANTQSHESRGRNNAKDYAVDGVLHYAKALKEEFNVLAIAVSGECEEELLVSHFYWKKNKNKYADLSDKKLLSIDDYMQVFEDQFFISDFYTRDIAYKARYLNEEFQSYTIPEYKRCTMVSAMLLALIDKRFKEEFECVPTIKELGRKMLSAINSVFEAETDIVRSKTVILREFENILNEPLFVQETIKHKEHKTQENTLQVAKDFIIYLQKNVYPLVEHSNIGYDVLGRFYVEFIRYAGSEQKSGLVLTPAHITELFCDLAELRISDIVYDPCCGTGGFLVAAMQRLFKLAGNNKTKREKIRKTQLCGCELRSDMFTYACSSMRFRGDGKSNLYNGSCFNNTESIADNHKPTVAMLNPPYDVGNAGQMEFVEHALNVINPQADGRVVAIVQMSCAIKDEKDLKAVKKRILAKHHLKAVLSMPDDLFYPVGVVTCIMVFEANKPNKGRKTWFGYFKDDGFEKRKHLGRIDARNKYSDIKNRWISAYVNGEQIPGLSVRQEITADDVWCAEAYMETNYETLCDLYFIKKMRDYSAFLVNMSNPTEPFAISNKSANNTNLSLSDRRWMKVKISDFCKKPYKATVYNAIDLVESDKIVGTTIPYITRTDVNNGCKCHVINENFDDIEEGNAITIGDTTATIYYQDNKFICGDHMVILRSDFFNKYIGLFIVTLLNMERFRYNYGRAFNKGFIANTELQLPVKPNSKSPDWQFMEDYIKSLAYSSNI